MTKFPTKTHGVARGGEQGSDPEISLTPIPSDREWANARLLCAIQSRRTDGNVGTLQVTVLGKGPVPVAALVGEPTKSTHRIDNADIASPLVSTPTVDREGADLP
jgi:hypothetical protein